MRGRGDGRGDGGRVAGLITTAGPGHARPWIPLYRFATGVVTSAGRVRYGFRVAGRQNVPASGGVLIACNHLADCDPAFVVSAIPGREAISLATTRHFTAAPLRELLLRLGAEPVRTDGTEISGLRFAREHLRGGGVVIVYPEGVPGFSAVVGPFADGAGWLASTPGVTVVPTAVWGTHRLMRRGLPVGRGPVSVAFGTPVAPNAVGGRGAAGVADTTGRIRTRVQDLVTGLSRADPD